MPPAWLLALWSRVLAWLAALWAKYAALFAITAPAPVVVPVAFTMAATMLPIWLLWQQNSLITTQTEYVRVQTAINRNTFQKEADASDGYIDDAIAKIAETIRLLEHIKGKTFDIRIRVDGAPGLFTSNSIRAPDFNPEICRQPPISSAPGCAEVQWRDAISPASIQSGPIPMATQALLVWSQFMRHVALLHRQMISGYKLDLTANMSDFVKAATETCATAANDDGLRAFRLAVAITGLGEASLDFNTVYLDANTNPEAFSGEKDSFTGRLNLHTVSLGTLMAEQRDRVQSIADLESLTAAAFVELDGRLRRLKQNCVEKKKFVAGFRSEVGRPPR